jgi:hypothetical protein
LIGCGRAQMQNVANANVETNTEAETVSDSKASLAKLLLTEREEEGSEVIDCTRSRVRIPPSFA